MVRTSYLFGSIGFVGSGIHSRITQIPSKSLRNWCEKTTVEPTKIKSEQDASPAFFICIPRRKLAFRLWYVYKKIRTAKRCSLLILVKPLPLGSQASRSQFFPFPFPSMQARSFFVYLHCVMRSFGLVNRNKSNVQ